VDGRIRWRSKIFLFGDFYGLAVNRGDRGPRLAERQPFNKRGKVGGQLPVSGVATHWPGKTNKPVGAIPGQPTLGGARRDASLTRGAGKRNLFFQVRPKDSEPRHGILALLLRQAGERCRMRGLAHRFGLLA
jgi:hypothetical protein